MNGFKTLIILTSFSLFNYLIIPQEIHADLSDVPNEYVVQCSGSHNSLSLYSRGDSDIVNRTGLFFAPGAIANVTTMHTITISNSATINLIPEFLDLGYQYSYSGGNSVGWTQANNTSSNLELVVKAFYDSYHVTSYIEKSSGSGVCRISYSNQSIYRGWGYDLAE